MDVIFTHNKGKISLGLVAETKFERFMLTEFCWGGVKISADLDGYEIGCLWIEEGGQRLDELDTEA